MFKSRFNLIYPIDKQRYLLLNALSGHADILSKEEYNSYNHHKLDPKQQDIFLKRGYLYETKDNENQVLNHQYNLFKEKMNREEIQFLLVPSYACNFHCDYCYQNSIETNPTMKIEQLEHFFHAIDKLKQDRSAYITLFGGEPLLLGKEYFDLIEKTFALAHQRNMDIAVVTNGFHIEAYLDLFKSNYVREIQVTLDGIKDIHDRRRRTKAGKGTFNQIVKGIDLLIENNIPVNLRVVVDDQNIHHLPDLAEYVLDKGWLFTPEGQFKTQLGRNYELFDCSLNPLVLLSRSELYSRYYEMAKESPVLMDFHTPSFFGIKELYTENKLPFPLFDACTACKSEWAADPSGYLYGCTALVGRIGYEVGQFDPDFKLFEAKVQPYLNRDITNIPGCTQCSLSLFCGGGCAAIADVNEKSLNQKDCRPVDQIQALGVKYFFGQ